MPGAIRTILCQSVPSWFKRSLHRQEIEIHPGSIRHKSHRCPQGVWGRDRFSGFPRPAHLQVRLWTRRLRTTPEQHDFPVSFSCWQDVCSPRYGLSTRRRRDLPWRLRVRCGCLQGTADQYELRSSYHPEQCRSTLHAFCLGQGLASIASSFPAKTEISATSRSAQPLTQVSRSRGEEAINLRHVQYPYPISGAGRGCNADSCKESRFIAFGMKSNDFWDPPRVEWILDASTDPDIKAKDIWILLLEFIWGAYVFQLHPIRHLNHHRSSPTCRRKSLHRKQN